MKLEHNFLVAATSSKGFFEWCIRKLTKSEYNHVMLLYVCPFWGRWWAIQVDPKGVRPIPLEKAAEGVDKWCLFEYEGKDLRALLPLSRSDMDDNYDYPGILGFLVKLIVKAVTGRDIRNMFHKKGELFCSEFAMKFLKMSGVPETETLDPATTSPADVVKFCMDGHGFKRVTLMDYLTLAAEFRRK